MNRDFKTVNHGKEKIDLGERLNSHPQGIRQLRPTELHLKEDGTKDNKPSFMFVLENPTQHMSVPAIVQISLDMLSQGFSELGYSLKPNT